MEGSAAKILPPTPEEIEAARIFLRTELGKSLDCPEEKMRDADEVFAEKRKMLEDLLNAKV
jgi:hypothetical protein